MYVARARSVAQAVTRAVDRPGEFSSGRFFSGEANRGTHLYARLLYVECAEQTQDSREYVRLKLALQFYGNVRAAIAHGHYT